MLHTWRAEDPETAARRLERGEVHVWRISLAHFPDADVFSGVLSPGERDRARRFHFDRDRHMYIIAHGALRRILAPYSGIAAAAITFRTGAAGKPALNDPPAPSHRSAVEFNMSHSGDFVLIAVAEGRAVGVDVEQWNHTIEHLSLADHFFSAAERSALRDLATDTDAVNEGFFNAWSRKEAYLKALGTGITDGLHHFDVSLRPGDRAALLADRTDAGAVERWSMTSLYVASGYAAALVSEAPSTEITLLDFSLS